MFEESVMNYLWKRRLSHAAHLLKEQQCSVFDSAMECGLGSSEIPEGMTGIELPARE